MTDVVMNIASSLSSDSSESSQVGYGSQQDSSSSASISPKPVLPLLPPCRICGETSSGFHYGANTCEACKGFFRRTLKRKKDYECVDGKGECVMNLQNRASCSYCRLEKCLEMGMGRDAIKTGRYTHEKKNKDIREVKILQRLSLSSSTFRSSTGIYSEEILDALLVKVVTAYDQYISWSPELSEIPSPEEKQFLEEEELRKSLFGEMNPVSQEEYMHIYTTTGIDIDGRENMLTNCCSWFADAVGNFVKFVKNIPEFKALPTPDQICLVKASQVDVWMLWHYPSINFELGLWTTPWGAVFSQEYLKQLTYSRELFERRDKCARRLQELKLTREENIIMGCIAFMSSDEPGLIAQSPIDDGQWQLVELLQLLLFRSHPSSHRSILPKCLAVLTELRTVRYLNIYEDRLWLKDWSDKIQIPPIIHEICP